MLNNAKSQFWNLVKEAKRIVINHPWVCLFCIVFLLWCSQALILTFRANRSGFDTKTLWDWMDLLVVPFVIAIGGLLFNLSQRKTELEVTSEKDQIAILDHYLDRMNNWLLNHNLLNSNYEDSVRKIARAKTLSTLQTLDSRRRAQVLLFLVEAELISFDRTILHIRSADFSGVQIGKVFWANKNFEFVNLSSADFSNSRFDNVSFIEAALKKVNFQHCEFFACSFNFTDLEGGNLKRAKLNKASLISANLSHADLSHADLSEVDLSGSNPPKGKIALLRNACLVGANLDGAHLYSADLSGADLQDTSLKEVKYNELTRWPEGFDPIAAGAILVKGTYSRFKIS